MPGIVNRRLLATPYSRLVASTAATAAFLSFFVLFALVAVNEYGPISDLDLTYAIPPVVLFLAFLQSVVVAYVTARSVARRARDDDNASDESSATDDADPISILKRRYAADELTEDELDWKMERLVAAGQSDDTVPATTDTDRLVE